jgi:hypothetical protein
MLAGGINVNVLDLRFRRSLLLFFIEGESLSVIETVLLLLFVKKKKKHTAPASSFGKTVLSSAVITFS